MLGNTNSSPFTMPVQPAYGYGGNGFGGNDGWGWIWILLIFGIFGGWGNGFGGFGGNGAGAIENYVLGSDFATIQRQLSDGFNGIDNALDRQNAGICDLGYTALAQSNQTNTNIMQAQNALATQLADCCCRTQSGIESVKTADVMNTMNITNAIKDCCCDEQMRGMQAEYNAQGRARDIQDTANANTRAILEKLCQMENNAKDEKIAAQAQKITQLELERSQSKQNEYIHDLVKPPINPTYLVAGNPYCSCGNANPFYPYGPYYGGTTIA